MNGCFCNYIFRRLRDAADLVYRCATMTILPGAKLPCFDPRTQCPADALRHRLLRRPGDFPAEVKTENIAPMYETWSLMMPTLHRQLPGAEGGAHAGQLGPTGDIRRSGPAAARRPGPPHRFPGEIYRVVYPRATISFFSPAHTSGPKSVRCGRYGCFYD